MSEQQPAPAGPVLVAVVRKQPAGVLRRAAELARNTGSRLVLAHVDVTLGKRQQSIDPDGIDDDAEDIAAGLRGWCAGQLEGTGLEWSFVTLAGDPVHELNRYAADIDASVIVVGSKERGLGKYLEALSGGSFGERLARHGYPPVLVVPPADRDRGGTA